LNVYGDMLRRLLAATLCAAVSLELSGCFLQKKAKAVVLPQSQAPVALATPPTDDLPMVAPPPEEALPVPIAAAASKPRIRRRVAPKPAITAATAATTPTPNVPTQVAGVEGLPEGSSIGELTAGGDASPQRRQEAADLIASNERRLKALPPRTLNAQRSQISKIHNFQRQAQEALDSGDAEGAKTLATKAGLLLYDLDHGGGS
jgi:hypothetical protein